MVSQDEVLRLLNDFNSIKPLEFLQRIDVSSMGIGNVLGYLCYAGHEVSAGEISDYMSVSTARVAVLLKKMSEKKLITKTTDPHDKRKVMVSITEEGKKQYCEKMNEIILYAGAIIDHIGIAKIEDFIASCKDIRDVVNRVEREQSEN